VAWAPLVSDLDKWIKRKELAPSEVGLRGDSPYIENPPQNTAMAYRRSPTSAPMMVTADPDGTLRRDVRFIPPTQVTPLRVAPGAEALRANLEEDAVHLVRRGPAVLGRVTGLPYMHALGQFIQRQLLPARPVQQPPRSVQVPGTQRR
jgi:hypothetical protein